MSCRVTLKETLTGNKVTCNLEELLREKLGDVVFRAGFRFLEFTGPNNRGLRS